jgi:hypothetical protein
MPHTFMKKITNKKIKADINPLLQSLLNEHKKIAKDLEELAESTRGYKMVSEQSLMEGKLQLGRGNDGILSFWLDIETSDYFCGFDGESLPYDPLEVRFNLRDTLEHFDWENNKEFLLELKATIEELL